MPRRCIPFSINGASGFICGVKTPGCKWCRKYGEYFCDFPVNPQSTKKKTCDAPMCRDHRTNVGPDKDYCPEHATSAKL